MKVKLSDYVASYLSKIGVDTVFAVSGGASLHLIHSIGKAKGIRYIAPHHEQAAAMAADGYARTKNDIGVAIATSGPGATNLITGMCCSYYDSVPVLFITGQVSTFRMTGNTGVRQIGFQETPIVDICKSITKNAVTILDPDLIRYELEKAVHIAKSGRPGPVLIDIPDNLQRATVDEEALVGYFPEAIENKGGGGLTSESIAKLLGLIMESERPIIVGGWGIHLSGTENLFIEFAEKLNIPVVLTWGAADIIPHNHQLYIGTFGTHGVRHANFAVQNADLVISLGSRLDTKATGSPITSFARAAKKIIIDIDVSELNKFNDFGLSVDLPINDSLQNFFAKLLAKGNSLNRKDYDEWFKKIKYWKVVSKRFIELNQGVAESVDPYLFMEEFSMAVKKNSKIFVDTGCSIAWLMQAGQFSAGTRIYHDCNNTAMGWALPASIGSYFSQSNSSIYCVVGDGSFMMTAHELATIKHHKIPIKIFLINNSGYAMIQQTQDQWLDSDYYASSYEGGLSFPEYEYQAKSYGIQYFEINTRVDLKNQLSKIMNHDGAFLCNVLIPKGARVTPLVKFGRPNEDMEPLLPRKVFEDCMIIEEFK